MGKGVISMAQRSVAIPTRGTLAMQESQLVTEVLRLHRDGSNLARMTGRLLELRALRARLSAAEASPRREQIGSPPPLAHG